MNQPKQPQGNFKMNLNFRRNGNDKAPPITGRISTPEDPEAEYGFSAFEQTDKNGESYWIGPVDTNRSMRQALNVTDQKGTNFIAIRENGFKVFKELHTGAPNPAYAKLSEADKKLNDTKPAFWATWTRTEAEPQIRASAWERDPSRYGPWASGNTQYPLSKDEAAALKAGKADAVAMNATEPAAAVPPPPRRAKTADRDRA